MDVRDAVNDVRPEALSELLVALDLALGVVLEVAVALEAALNEAAELGGEGVVVEEVVDAQAGAGGLAGVCWADALLGGADAELQGEDARGRACGERSLPRSSELDLLQSVDDLVEVED